MYICGVLIVCSRFIICLCGCMCLINITVYFFPPTLSVPPSTYLSLSCISIDTTTLPLILCTICILTSSSPSSPSPLPFLHLSPSSTSPSLSPPPPPTLPSHLLSFALQVREHMQRLHEEKNELLVADWDPHAASQATE